MPDIKALIDHVVISVGEALDAGRERYKQLGFTLTERGHHSHGSSNHLIMFDNDYLELLGYEPKNHERALPLLGPFRGLSGLVFKTDDAQSLYSKLASRGLALEGEGPKAFFRPVALPDGSTPQAHFRTVRLDPSATPNGRIYFCQHHNPELVWRDEWQHHANGVRSISRVVIEARDPQTSICLLQKAFAIAAPLAVKGGLRLQAGHAFVDYLSPEAAEAEFPGALAPRPNQGDRKIALTLRTDDLEQTRCVLHQGGIAFTDTQQNTVLVPASEAFGVALVFTA